MCGPTKAQVDHVVAVLLTLFHVEDQGNLNDYLGVKVAKLPNGCFSLSQPHLIQSIIKDMNLPPHTNPKDMPALISKPLQPDPNGKPFSQTWSYRSIIGKLNFLEKSTWPDIAYAVHQCARFTTDPRASHDEAVKRIVCYLIGTADEGFIMTPTDHSFECWVMLTMLEIGIVTLPWKTLQWHALVQDFWLPMHLASSFGPRACKQRLHSALQKLSTSVSQMLYAK